MNKLLALNNLLSAFGLFMLVQACSPSSSSATLSSSDFPYNLDKPEVFPLPLSLLEISGIAFNKGNAKITYAIQDEKGAIYQLNKDEITQKTQFIKNGDYEDLSILNNQIYVLQSSGKVFTTALSEMVNKETTATSEIDIKLPKGEYESLYADPETQSLFILCKKCDKKNSILGFQYDLKRQKKKPETFEIKTKNFSKKGFAASALARNPIDKDWYVISAINASLLVFDTDWNFKESIELKKDNFRQPEGIAFDQAGHLYISSEGDDFTKGKILKFSRITD
ncbi:SdiA-regulated domain-containing protein [uncultured Arcticibacterium sp.]|uniref:SdiA-regulated domain-containing protein n=1 Tax=uncultured Arcticibacterium sp. TaxID=2173042 RepID=UPI0030FB8E0B